MARAEPAALWERRPSPARVSVTDLFAGIGGVRLGFEGIGGLLPMIAEG
jgi:hypothetical protein